MSNKLGAIQNELSPTSEISVVPNGRYWNVKEYRTGVAENDNAPVADNSNEPMPEPDWMHELDDCIPF